MSDQLTSFLERIKGDPRVSEYDEASTKQAIILPVLQLLGWDTYNIEEVTPERQAGTGRVDYSLRINGKDKLFLEVKPPRTPLETHEEQLLQYSFREGVQIAVLTNGTTWWFYLPLESGDWQARKFYTIDIEERETPSIAQGFVDLLSRKNIATGEASQMADRIHRGRQRERELKETLPRAWNKIVSEPDSLLVDLLTETTGKLCGFEPQAPEVSRFLKEHVELLVVEAGKRLVNNSGNESRKRGKRRSLSPGEEPLRRPVIVDSIVLALGERGGCARKEEIERAVYDRFKEYFCKPYYQEKVSHGVPRWQHEIAWAKEDAKLKKGYIKRPKDSGWGLWELTERGKQHYHHLRAEKNV